MRCASCAQSRHPFVALIIFSAFLAAPAVAGEIFKCVAKDGSPLYQNFPCHIDSLGWSPSNPPAAKTPATPGAATQEKPKTEPVNAASTVKSPSTGEPRIDITAEPRVGMTTEEAKALWGEPDEMWEDEPGDGPRVSNWRYADGRTVQFDHRHRVLGVQR